MEEAQEASDKLKQALIEASSLAFPYPERVAKNFGH